MDYRITNEAEVCSPALLIDMDAVEANIREMVAMTGGPERLRTHVKTHKLPQIVQAQLAQGITKFKTATVAEAEMTAAAGGPDILLAVAPVGPNIGRFIALMKRYPEVRWLTIGDDAGALEDLAKAARENGVTAGVLLDVDTGQGRTGTGAGPKAVALGRLLQTTEGLSFEGLHAYDGHIHQPEAVVREAACGEALGVVEQIIADLAAAGLATPPRIVAGGSPTFSFHAENVAVECSPGTCVLWDAGYGAKMPELKFQPAARLLTRVISRPRTGRLCLDLGHKAVGSEMAHPRAVFPELPQAVPVMHNEEHLVLETDRAADYPPGSVLYAVPWHVCPTVALYSECHVVRGGAVVDVWPVTARARRLTI